MYKQLVLITLSAVLASTSAHAINDKYRKQLERSGCTQVSELQGCDIHKTREENAKAGFAETDGGAPAAQHSRNLVAKSDSGATVATIRIQADGKVWVSGKPVAAKNVGGALHFQQGLITYTVSDNPEGQSFWMDTDAGTKGSIIRE
ncbi:hypothetical protein [Pseudomonas sp. EA_105y_Pfl2_R69]|uniref:hypothetical protein n=1 Tax=Pseudomonas sp. EA_105y_Pfl2_R69 TaxID=3088683 RepID=UPI0030DC99B9